MPNPKQALLHILRNLNKDGVFFLSVDVGGQPTPDEPSPFTMESLITLLKSEFEILPQSDNNPSFNEWRDYSVRVLARKKHQPTFVLSKDKILEAYEASIINEEQFDL
jgi:hypothetical protein